MKLSKLVYNRAMDNRKRLQVDLSPEKLKKLRRLALEMIEEDGRAGAGTLAVRVLDVLAEHPEMIQQLLDEYAHNQGAADSPPIEQTRPFPATPPASKQRKARAA